MTNTELGFTVRQMIPTAIAASFPVVVTVDNHGLSNGQYVRATNFFVSPAHDATGMEQLNNQLFIVGNITTNTFDLFDQFELPVDGTLYTTFVDNGIAQFTLTGPALNTQNLNTQEG